MSPCRASARKIEPRNWGTTSGSTSSFPLFFDQLDIQTATKPWVIIGGRGCGKTMLLRYLSHQSTFSPQRPSVPDETIRHLGLYWKVDTQLLKPDG